MLFWRCLLEAALAHDSIKFVQEASNSSSVRYQIEEYGHKTPSPLISCIFFWKSSSDSTMSNQWNLFLDFYFRFEPERHSAQKRQIENNVLLTCIHFRVWFSLDRLVSAMPFVVMNRTVWIISACFRYDSYQWPISTWSWNFEYIRYADRIGY